MPTRIPPPSESELHAVLGGARALWNEIVRQMETAYAPLDRLWKPSKAGFGRMCLLQHKTRTLLYLTPDDGKIWVAIVLGDRAYRLAMAIELPAAIKTMLSAAKPYAEGRGIRFAVSSTDDIRTIVRLLECKTAPR